MKLVIKAVLLVCLLSEGALAQTAPAQTPKKRPLPAKFYIGAQLAAHQYFVQHEGFMPNKTNVSPWYVNLGYRFLPRFALQAGVLSSHVRDDHQSTFVMPNGGGIRYSNSSDQEWNTAIPVALRFTLVRRLDQRFKIDVFAGGTWVHSRALIESSQTLAGVTTNYERKESRAPGYFLSLGVSGRYILTRRWEVIFDHTRNRNLAAIPAQTYFLIRGRESPWIGSVGIGGCYRFDVKKKAATPEP
jgi:hypothetical protein